MKNPKFYEFDSNNFAYYALIIAEAATDAKTAYRNEVGDIEDDAEPNEITVAEAKEKLAHAKGDYERNNKHNMWLCNGTAIIYYYD